MTFEHLVPTLQLAIGPVILVSGVGLILLSMTNRFGRIIDRSRDFAGQLTDASDPQQQLIRGQLRILVRRAKLLRAGIALAVFSALMAALLIISLFLSALLQLDLTGIIVSVFVGCLLCLIVSLLLFISDINLSLNALWLEIPRDTLG